MTENDGRMFITLKPLDQRTASADQVIARLNQGVAAGLGHHPVHAGGAGYHDRRAAVEDPVPIYLDRCRQRRARPLGADSAEEAAGLPQLTDVASDQQSTGRVMKVEVNRAGRLAARHQPVGRRRDPLRRVRPARRGAHLHHAQPVLRDSRSRTRLPARAQRAEPHLRDLASGAEVPLSEFAKITSTVAPLAVNHQGQFPSVTLSFNLPPSVSIGDSRNARSRKPPPSCTCRARSPQASRAAPRRSRLR